MAKIIFNRKIDSNIYHLKIEGDFEGSRGQFYMLRGWSGYHPVLSRPFSIFDRDSQSISFIYQVVGEGTRLLSKLKKEDNIQIFGPYGKGFPSAKGKVALIGGGMGLAALYLAAKELKADAKVELVDIYLGFKEKAVLADYFEKVAHKLIIDIGGLISQRVNVNLYDYIFTCGPEEMMKAIVKQKKGQHPQIFISLERRMGCGLGACLSCTCQTSKGNKYTCQDGPVFRGEEIFFA